jgi:chromate transport protein ChrA
VGYKVAGIAGSLVAAAAVFLPSFILMLALLPMLDSVRRYTWTKAVRSVSSRTASVKDESSGPTT